MRPLDRRQFLNESALLAAAATALGGLGNRLSADQDQPGKKGPASEKLRVAVVGVRGRGMSHVYGFANRHNCVITTVCDADKAVIANAMKYINKEQGSEPKFEQDIRKVVEDKDIDVISIATPNHWHALMAIWAMQNGKHVYVEKPVSHNVLEGRRIVEAARKYGKICQTGTQSRSQKGMREAIEFLHAGKLGKIRVARGLCYKRRTTIGKVKGPQKLPETVDYDLWCGPAPKKPLMRAKLHYDWHWVWDTGNGDLGNQGIHQMDIARWGLGKNELARSAISIGGRFGYVDDGETANTQIIALDYGDSELIFEVRGLPTKDLLGTKVGVIFSGSDGTLVCPNYESAIVYDKGGKEVKRFTTPKGQGGDGVHFANFVKAVRSGKTSDLNADILEGHLSSALCHLGNISYRLGTIETLDKSKKPFNDKVADETTASMIEHLEENKIDLDGLKYHLGRKLILDQKTETFVKDKEANAMLTREYRAGFVVPDKV